jgi:hypothetical protein
MKTHTPNAIATFRKVHDVWLSGTDEERAKAAHVGELVLRIIGFWGALDALGFSDNDHKSDSADEVVSAAQAGVCAALARE